MKLNVIPIICHEEDEEEYKKWIENNKNKEKLKTLLHVQRKEWKKFFDLKSVPDVLEERKTNQNFGKTEFERITNEGVVYQPELFSKETQPLLAATFVVFDSKVVMEYRKEHKYQRFDVARICLDTDSKIEIFFFLKFH